MIKSPLVSVIIVNYNGRKLLEKCFQSLTKVTYSNYEIILVDNNSEDDSIQYIKENFPNTIILKLKENYGFAYPNNIASKNAKGDYLLFLNNDTTVTTSFMEELVKKMETDQKIGICQSMLLKPKGEVDSSGDFVDVLGIVYSSKERITSEREALSAKGASMMIRKQLFKKLGGFDETFYFSFEDVDLGWRSWIFGYKVLVIPQSVVYHMVGQTIPKAKPNLAFHGFKNQLSMKLTNFEGKLAFNAILKFFLIYGFRMIRVLFDYNVRGRTKITGTKYEETLAQKPNLKAIIKSFVWILRNMDYIRNKQKNVNKNRVYKTSDLINRNVIVK